MCVVRTVVVYCIVYLTHCIPQRVYVHIFRSNQWQDKYHNGKQFHQQNPNNQLIKWRRRWWEEDGGELTNRLLKCRKKGLTFIMKIRDGYPLVYIQKENEFFVIKYVTWKQRWSFFHSFFCGHKVFSLFFCRHKWKMFHKSKKRKNNIKINY